jgi:hypothetical protein
MLGATLTALGVVRPTAALGTVIEPPAGVDHSIYRGSVDPSRLGSRSSAGREELPFDLALPESRPPAHGPRNATALAPAPPAVASTASGAQAEAFGWIGIPMTDVDDPTATTVAIGPDDVMQTAGQWIGIYERSGVDTHGSYPVPASQFFAVPTTFSTYWPRFIYDDTHARWIGTATSFICDYNQDGDLSDPVGILDILVSRTANPEGLWDAWGLGWNGYLPDDVAAGTSTDKVGFSLTFWHIPTGCETSSLAGSAWVALDFAELLDPANRNQPLALAYDSLSGPSFVGPTYGLRMAQQTPATDAPLYGVAVEIDGDVYRPIYVSIAGKVATNTIAWTYVDLADSLVATVAEPPSPIQPGGSELVDFLDSPILTATWRRDRLLYVANDACTPPGDTTLRDCVRVTELSTTAAQSPTRLKDFWIAEEGADNFYGAAGYALDGTFHAAWTRVANEADGYAVSRTAYHPLSAPRNSITSPVDVAGAQGAMTIPWRPTRSVVAYDPQAPDTAWVANQFGAADGLSFRTHVTSLQVAIGDTFAPIEPLRVLDTRDGTGLSSPFKSNVPRTFNVAGAGNGTIPASAVAITGNLTVAGQGSAGYVSVGPSITASPTSSTINFPVGDVRANNLTLPLNGNGDLMAVFKGAPTKATHLILDVTGYFLADDSGATYQPMTAARVLDSRDGTGLTGKFVANAPRTFPVSGVGGIPLNATAVTGNLTVVGQSRAGYVSLTPEPDATPGTSTINFPLGDIRANGVTVRLSETGSLSAVFKANGGSTDLVFDVTGYYVEDLSGFRFYPLNPGRIMDTRFNTLTQLFGPFTSSVPRNLDTAGHFGVPQGGLAVTGNLTVVGQTTAGYVSITKSPTATPPVSTLNFPAGDTRANGITVPLNASGNMGITYKASPGARTHLILDVTGYFK